MASSPTPSLESLPGANSIGSFGEPTEYLSDSPSTVSGSGSSPPISDSAICDDFVLTSSSVESQNIKNNTNTAGVTVTSTLQENIIITSGNQQQSQQKLSEFVNSVQQNTENDSLPRCEGCRGKHSIAVAKCADCVNWLCANCEAAHEFMHCFDGHKVFRINNSTATTTQATTVTTTKHNNIGEEFTSKLIMNGFESQRLSLNLNLKDDPSNLMKSIMNSVITPPTPNPTSQQQQQNGNNNMTAITATADALFSTLNTTLSNGKPLANSYFCQRHKSELLKFFCRSCNQLVCKDCMMLEHTGPAHECEHNSDPVPKQIEALSQTIQDIRSKSSEMRQIIKGAEHNSVLLQTQYHTAQNEINETFQFYRSMLEERKAELLKELESVYSAKSMAQTMLINKSQDHLDKMLQSCELVDRILAKCADRPEMLRKILENKKQQFLSYLQDLQNPAELDFCSNYQAIQVGIRNTFGYIRSSGEMTSANKQPPIARPTMTNNQNIIGSGMVIGGMQNMTNGSSPTSSTSSLNMMQGQMINTNSNVIERPFSNGGMQTTGLSTSPIQQNHLAFDTNILSKRFNSANSLGPFIGDLALQNNVNPYEKWSNGGTDIFNNINDQYCMLGTNTANSGTGSVSQPDTMMDLTNKLMSSSMFPLKSQIKRQKMIYHCKFGEFGVMEGQFTEPSGVAVNAQNDIIVADTNNHRIQIFDKEGRFKFQFGECGKRDGQLLYPNRVAVVKTSGDIIVTERSPTHQIQIYNQYGQFVRKFGANILQHPRGVTVDNKGRIIVVECKVMRVIIFDQNGNVLQKFGCSKHLEFPNGVVVNEKQEIFISDNRAHCVKVFNYEGVYLRQIGGEGITNYPIGVGINSNGEILIADNHNNFNLTIFTQDNQIVSALESKVKHAQCFDVALMDDGSVVLASKDYRLYIYRYVQVPPIGL
uniref:CSON002699 protein n=1 Tax=Culicoides sonorensis TaxID=179676 RepID=A0A336MNA1_CULSO